MLRLIIASGEMTKELDNPLALSGLARKVADITGDPYVAGIWKNDLARGLLWTTSGGTRLFPYQAPMWSWCPIAARDCSIYIDSVSEREPSYEPPEFKPVMEFVSAELLGEDPFHRLRPGLSLKPLGMIEQARALINGPHEYCDVLELRGRARVFIEHQQF
jgi:hypothetical protein